MSEPRFDCYQFYPTGDIGGCGSVTQYPVFAFLSFPGDMARGALIVPFWKVTEEGSAAE
jgi:hypothetical protein